MLDPMIMTAVDQSTKNYQLLDSISQNLGNYNTYGYKGRRFEMYISADQQVHNMERTDFSQGPISLTKRELDVALEGPGFIQVTRPNGTTAYTRNGGFMVNQEGFITTPHGDLVGTGIKVPLNYHQLKITREGTVEITEKQGEASKPIGQLTIANFNNPEGLKNLGYNLWQQTDASGPATLVEDPRSVRQGYLERTNVDIHYSVVDLLRLNAGVFANLRMVKLVDEIYKEAVNLRQ